MLRTGFLREGRSSILRTAYLQASCVQKAHAVQADAMAV